jgi:hypothetical protein
MYDVIVTIAPNGIKIAYTDGCGSFCFQELRVLFKALLGAVNPDRIKFRVTDMPILDKFVG